jgi:L-ascorbate metabolism protein UlaG (beta-lactamase superfamily)
MSTTISWLGHSTVQVDMAGSRIVTDPVLRRRLGHLWRQHPLRASDWPEHIDAILVSHMHWDHLDLPTLHRLGDHTRLFAPTGAGSWLKRRGFEQVQEMAVGDEVRVGNVTVHAVQARHSGRRPPFGPSAEAIGFILSAEQRVYFPGDTDLFPEMASLAGKLDVALLPVWGWGPTLGTGHLDPERAAEAAQLMRPRVAIPIHWGTFHPIGATLIDRSFLVDPPRRFELAVRRLAPDVDVRILQPGDSVTL